MTDETPKPVRLKNELDELRPEVEKVLPPQVSLERFMRVVYTALAQSPQLRTADRRSLLTSAMKAAQDGLLPDGREAAFVPFKTKEKFRENGKQMERWIEKVSYMPMVAGILKKMRQSGEMKQLSVNVVREGDTFRFWTDDSGEHLMHEPLLGSTNRQVIAAYARMMTLNGGIYTEVMSRFEIEQVRSISKTKDDGPWVDWFDEMSKKTVLRRLSKRTPMSTDVVSVIQRDDDLYDVNQRTRRAVSGAAAAKEMLGLTHEEQNDLPLQVPAPEAREITVDVGTGEVVDAQKAEARPATSAGAGAAQAALEKATTIYELDEAMETVSTLYASSKRRAPEEITALYRKRREEFQGIEE